MKTTLLFFSVFLSLSLYSQSTIGNWTEEDKSKCISNSEKDMKGKDELSLSLLEIYEVNSIQLSNCKCDYLETKWKNFESYDINGRSNRVMNAQLIKTVMKNCIEDNSEIGNWTEKMKIFCKKNSINDCMIEKMEKEYENVFDGLHDFTLYPNKMKEYMKLCE